MLKDKKEYNVRIFFENDDLLMLREVMDHYRIGNGKDLLMFLLAKEYRSIVKKETIDPEKRVNDLEKENMRLKEKLDELGVKRVV